MRRFSFFIPVALCVGSLLSCDMRSSQERTADAFREFETQKQAELERQRQETAASNARMHAEFDADEKKAREQPNIKPPAALVADPVGDWLRAAPADCAFRFNQSACSSAPAAATQDQKTECNRACSAAIKAAAESRFVSAFDTCANSTDEKPTCTIEFPVGADPSGKGEEATFREAVGELQTKCAQGCAKQRIVNANEAKERDKAAHQGGELVLSYKRCMLATDGTLEAIRYRVHDTALYEDLMQKTDAKCRAGSRCDWLEKHSDEFQCSYGN